MELSQRLTTIASMVTKGSVVADIGTDHGYIPIALVKEHICSKAYAMDISDGPLERARKHIQLEGVEDSILCLKSDGLKNLPQGEVDTVVIAGMGGDLVVSILDDGLDRLAGTEELILGPQSHVEKVRYFLQDHGYTIAQEEFLQDGGKYYAILRCVPGQATLGREVFYWFAKDLLENKNMVLFEYLQQEEKKYNNILNHLETQEPKQDNIQRRREEISHRIELIKEAMTYYHS